MKKEKVPKERHILELSPACRKKTAVRQGIL
jgi:hypothetical protein